VRQPCDFRLVGLHRTAGYILGLDPREEPPLVKLPDDSRPIEEPYVLLGAQAGLPLSLGGVNVTPHLGGLFAYYRGNAFTESGSGGQNLSVDTDNARSLQPYVGISIDKAFGDSAKALTLKLNVDYGYELARLSRSVTVISSDGTAFTAPGATLPRGRLVAGFSAAGSLTKHTQLSAGYTTWLNTGGGSQQGVDAAIRYRY
jgi:uncharacterized protein with beta-barrel porin domain